MEVDWDLYYSKHYAVLLGDNRIFRDQDPKTIKKFYIESLEGGQFNFNSREIII